MGVAPCRAPSSGCFRPEAVGRPASVATLKRTFLAAGPSAAATCSTGSNARAAVLSLLPDAGGSLLKVQCHRNFARGTYPDCDRMLSRPVQLPDRGISNRDLLDALRPELAA